MFDDDEQPLFVATKREVFVFKSLGVAIATLTDYDEQIVDLYDGGETSLEGVTFQDIGGKRGSVFLIYRDGVLMGEIKVTTAL